MIVVDRLTRSFGDRTAVRNVSFEVRPSELVALLGPNGAGKTTVMRMIAGLIEPSSGSVVIGGVRLTASSSGHVRERIGFLTESPGLWDRLTVRENLEVFAGIYGLPEPARAIDRMLERLGLAERSTTRTAELSKGMRQKVALARALLHGPDVLLLDEPTSGLDPAIALDVRELLLEHRARGCAILLSTHNLDEAGRIADRVALLQTTLLAIERPEALRRRFTTGRTRVRVRGDSARYLRAARARCADAEADGDTLTVHVADADRDTPAFVNALVAAGAAILDVRTDLPALEEVYLRLVAGHEPIGEALERPPCDRVPDRTNHVWKKGPARWPPVLRKEVVDLMRNRAALLPIAISMLAFVALPLFVAVVIPGLTGESLGEDADLAKVSVVAGAHPELTLNGRVQLFLFEQFLTVFLLMPITGAMTLAAHAVVGEKLARTLEPLLATPLTTAELLIAKVAGALLPTVAIAVAGLAVYFGLIAWAAEPRVLAALLNARTFVVTLLTGPAAALVALQAAVLVSSRVNDPRTAQQVGILIIVPLTGVLIAQFTGALWVNAAALAFAALGLFGVWILLALASVSLFEREAILTKWR